MAVTFSFYYFMISKEKKNSMDSTNFKLKPKKNEL